MNAVLVHELPRRMRFVVDVVRRDTTHADRLRDRIAVLPGISGVETSRLTGSLIVSHDGVEATRGRIVACLADAGHPLLARPVPTPARPGRRDGPLLSRVLTEVLVEHALRAALVAVI